MPIQVCTRVCSSEYIWRGARRRMLRRLEQRASGRQRRHAVVAIGSQFQLRLRRCAAAAASGGGATARRRHSAFRAMLLLPDGA